jgi:hypothetical protein
MFQYKSNDTNFTQYNQVLVALFFRSKFALECVCPLFLETEVVHYKAQQTEKQDVRFVNRTGVVVVFTDLLGILDSHPGCRKEHPLVFPQSFDLVIELYGMTRDREPSQLHEQPT